MTINLSLKAAVSRRGFRYFRSTLLHLPPCPSAFNFCSLWSTTLFSNYFTPDKYQIRLVLACDSNVTDPHPVGLPMGPLSEQSIRVPSLTFPIVKFPSRLWAPGGDCIISVQHCCPQVLQTLTLSSPQFQIYLLFKPSI